MRIFTAVMGLVVAFMGLLPSLVQRNLITGAAVQVSEPSSFAYQGVIIALGIIIALSSVRRMFD